MKALFTNRVKGRTATPGATEATKAACPWRGVARAVTQAVSTGPPTAPSTVLTWAASAPVPTKASPNWVLTAGGGQVSGGWAKGSVRP